jgi:dTDP-4-amino-4,6-dideoxygalactose transaminase
MQEKLAIQGGTPTVRDMEIPVWPQVSRREIAAVIQLLENNTLSIYDRSGIYAEFEDNFAAYHGTSYALSHNSGTSALHAAFYAAGIGPGDEILAPTYTFLATVTPILQTGATPVLCEMDSETMNIDPQDVRTRVTTNTKAIVITHMWGHPCEMDDLIETAETYNLVLIEDCSHGHGAMYKGRKVGTFGHIGCFSLEGHKAVHAGEGGMLITNNREYYERAILLGHFGKRAKQEVSLEPYRRYVETGLGYKYRMHPLGAAIANERLKILDQQNAVRRENMRWFSERISEIPGIAPPTTRTYCTRGGWYGYKPMYRADELDNLPIDLYVETLRAEGVPVKKPGSKPLHLLPLFQDYSENLRCLGSHFRNINPAKPISYRQGDFPIAEHCYERLLSLPVFAEPAKPLLEIFARAMEKISRQVGHIDRR